MAKKAEKRPAWNAPFDAQLAFFRNKLNLPTERWTDIMRNAHDRAFMVAGAQGADLLHDLRGAIDTAISKGTGIEAFRKEFRNIVKKHGWASWTGQGYKAGEAWRTKVIYQTNMTTSYAAGRLEQLNDPDLVKVRPYWQYNHNDSVMYPRPEHVSWDGMVLPRDHAFWRTHYPPNGWGCQCWVSAVSKEAFLRATAAGKGASAASELGDITGIDKGFDYVPGAGVDLPLRQMVQDKLINYPPAITRALSADVNRHINATANVADFARRALDESQFDETLWLGFVENFDDVTKVAGQDTKGHMVLLPAKAPRHHRKAHGHDGAGQRTATPADYAQIASVLAEPDSLRKGAKAERGNDTVIATKQIGQEVFRCVFEIRPGKRNRALALKSLVIKTGGK